MAYFGASMPWIAEFDEKTKKYTNALKCGEMVKTYVTPQYNEASLFGNNRKTDEIRLLKAANVTLGVTTMPAKAVNMMFGHKINEDGSELSNTSDENKYVGYAFITKERVNKKTKYRACMLHQVMFVEGGEEIDTQGENIAFKTPEISGSAIALDNGDWRLKSPKFDTEEEADAWIMKEFGVEESAPEVTE